MDAHDMLWALKHRRSIGLKDLSPDPIDLSNIELMLEAANWAPSHGRAEAWRFTVFSGEGRRILGEAFAEAYRQMTPAEKFDSAVQEAQRNRAWQAPVWISIGMARDDKSTMPEWEDLISVGVAVHNMQLIACSLGLGCKWSSGAVSTHPHVARFIGLELPSRLLGFLYVGKPAIAWPQGARRPMADKVKWVTNSIA